MKVVSLIKQGADWSTGWCVEPRSVQACTGQSIQQFNVASDRITVKRNDAITGPAIDFNAWGRVTDCPKLTLSTTATGSACTLCLVVTTDGRVESHAGSCPNDCNAEGEDMSWAGACS